MKKLHEIPVNVTPHPDYIQRKTRFAPWLERFFYRHRDKLVWIHAAMFVFFMVLLFLPLFLPEPLQGATPLNNFTEFSIYLFWGLWFPLVFVSVLFSGRSWCGILCPLGAASQWSNKIGLKRKIPAWLRWEGTPIVSFIIVTILGQTLDVRDQPLGLAELFGGVLVIALIIGFLYGRNKRAWCRHACPIGLLLGVFSRLGALEFAPKHKQPGGDTYTEKGVCPTMIAVSRKEESRHCIECFRCVKPSSNGGLFLRFRKPGEEIEKIRQYNPNLAEIIFMFLATGVALGGFLWLILPSYQVIKQALGSFFIDNGWMWVGNAGPAWLMSVHPEQRQVFNWLEFIMIVGFMTFYMFAALGLLTLCNSLSAWFAGRFGGGGSFKQRFTQLGYQFAPVAMISIIIGLGELLFKQLSFLGLNALAIEILKIALFTGAIAWSFYLGHKILSAQHLKGLKKWITLSPGLLGSLMIGAAWWPAIFGLHYSVLGHYRHALVLAH